MIYSDKNIISDRIPPHDIDAEMALLGSILMNPQAYSKAIPHLVGITENCFYVPAHQYIFNAIVALSNKRKVLDAITLRHELDKSGTLEDSGGLPYLTDLLGVVPVSSNAGEYAKTVQEFARKREMITILEKGLASVWTEDADTIATDVRTGLIECEPSTRRGLIKIGDMVQEVVEDLASYMHENTQRSDIVTGFRDLDDLIVHPKSDSVMILAARTSIGKSAVALNIARNVAQRQGKPVLFFSLEMSIQACLERVMQMVGEVNIHEFKRGRTKDVDITQISAAGMSSGGMPLWINDTSRIDLDEMISVIRLHVENNGSPSLIVIDYLQLISLGGISHRNIDLRQRTSIVSGALKEIAREFNTPVICLSQLSRIAGDKPELIHLAESGSIENDADYVVLMSRVTSDHEHDYRVKLLLNLAKNRHGPIGKSEVLFIQAHQLVRDLKDRNAPDTTSTGGENEEREEEQQDLY